MGKVFDMEDGTDEPPRSNLRGIKAELRRSLTRLCSGKLRRGSPGFSSLQTRWAGFPFYSNKLENIQVKANKKRWVQLW